MQTLLRSQTIMVHVRSMIEEIRHHNEMIDRREHGHVILSPPSLSPLSTRPNKVGLFFLHRQHNWQRRSLTPGLGRWTPEETPWGTHVEARCVGGCCIVCLGRERNGYYIGELVTRTQLLQLSIKMGLREKPWQCLLISLYTELAPPPSPPKCLH